MSDNYGIFTEEIFSIKRSRKFKSYVYKTKQQRIKFLSDEQFDSEFPSLVSDLPSSKKALSYKFVPRDLHRTLKLKTVEFSGWSSAFPVRGITGRPKHDIGN